MQKPRQSWRTSEKKQGVYLDIDPESQQNHRWMQQEVETATAEFESYCKGFWMW